MFGSFDHLLKIPHLVSVLRGCFSISVSSYLSFPTPSFSCLLTMGTFGYLLFGSQLELLNHLFLESLYPQLPYHS